MKDRFKILLTLGVFGAMSLLIAAPTTQLMLANVARKKAGASEGGGGPGAFVNGSSFGSAASSGTTVLPAINATTGNTVFVITNSYLSPTRATVTSVTDNASNTYSIAGSSGTLADENTFDIWYSSNITGNAALVVTVNHSSACEYRYAAALQYAGQFAYDAESTPLITASGTTHTSNTVTTTGNDRMVLAAFVGWDNYYAMTGASGTTIQVQESEGEVGGGDLDAPTTGGYTVSMTIGTATTYLARASAFYVP